MFKENSVLENIEGTVPESGHVNVRVDSFFTFIVSLRNLFRQSYVEPLIHNLKSTFEKFEIVLTLRSFFHLYYFVFSKFIRLFFLVLLSIC